MEALESVKLADVADKRVATFSRGMRQRLGIAEIVMKQAEVAILDEPTSGLDPHATFELLEMIRGLKRRCRGAAVARICSIACRASVTGWRCSTTARSP